MKSYKHNHNYFHNNNFLCNLYSFLNEYKNCQKQLKELSKILEDKFLNKASLQLLQLQIHRDVKSFLLCNIKNKNFLYLRPEDQNEITF